MIGRIRGTLLRRELDRVEVLTAGGVGYDIEIPRSVFERLPKEGEEVELRTVQVVREDSITLYGFLDGAERNVFARLLTASGVGPKLALGMLSTMPPARLVRAILDRDVPTLRQIPGFGTKKAEKLVVEMNDRLGRMERTLTELLDVDSGVVDPALGGRLEGLERSVASQLAVWLRRLRTVW